MVLHIKDEGIWGPWNLCTFRRHWRLLVCIHWRPNWTFLWRWSFRYHFMRCNRGRRTWKRRSVHKTKSIYRLVNEANYGGTKESTVSVGKLAWLGKAFLWRYYPRRNFILLAFSWPTTSLTLVERSTLLFVAFKCRKASWQVAPWWLYSLIWQSNSRCELQ